MRFTLLRATTLALSLAALSACMNSKPPRDLDLSLSRPTSAQRYVVELAPPETVRVNQIHSWRVTVKTPSGEPVPQAAIRVSGGMPEHGHGFPTQPRVTAQAQPGQYLLEGMKFNMTGWWEIKLDVASAHGQDGVTFNTVLPASAQ